MGTPEQVKDFFPPLLDWLEEKPDNVETALSFLTTILEVRGHFGVVSFVFDLQMSPGIEPRSAFVVEVSVGDVPLTPHTSEIS